MYRFFGEQDAYSLFNTIAWIVLYCSSFFFVKTKKASLGSLSKLVVYSVARTKVKLSKILEIVFACVECLLTTVLLNLSTYYNMSFGELVGTGGNYFASLMIAPLAWLLLSTLFVANPLKQLDFGTVFMPLYLFFGRLACFFNGCCWGIPWEYGLYNYHHDHPGRQVPVQLFEAIFLLVIFIFFLWYRKRAKTGTMFPIYLILYGTFRFVNEFFTADYPAIIGPFKMYHVLCVIAIVCGVILLVVVAKKRESINNFYEKLDEKIKNKYSLTEEQQKEREMQIAREMQSKKAKALNKEKQKQREKKAKETTRHSRSL